MKRQTKINLCIILLLIGLFSFILQVFVFEASDGNIGFLLVLISVCLMICSIIKLCQLSTKIKNSILDFLNLIFPIR